MAQQEIQKKAKAYLEKHQIEEILGDIITTLSHHQIKNPVIYIIKYLATVHCSQKELQDAGIKIDSKEKIEAPVLCLPFPNFTQHQGSIKKMTKEQFYGCKNKITDQGNNFRSICKLIGENPKSKPGLFAVDPSSYQIYSDLFEPIVKEKGYLNPPTRDLSYVLSSTILDDVRPYLEESIFILRRNVPKQRFGSTIQNRQSLSKELQQILTTQQSLINYSLSYDLGQLAQEDVRRLQINDKLYKKKDTNQPTIQHIFKDGRHPDWPNDRLLLQSSDKQNIVWINREDHMKFKFLSTEKSSILDSIDQCCKMNQFLDSKNLASFDDKFGYHTVKPQFSGLGLTFTLKFKLDPQSINKIKTNSNSLSQKIQNRVMNIFTKEKDKHFTIKSDRCTGLSMRQFIEQLCQILTILFEGVIKKPDTLYVERQFSTEQQSNSSPLKAQLESKLEQEVIQSPKKQSQAQTGHIAIDILQPTNQEELDYFTFHKQRLDSKKSQEKQYTLDKLVSDLNEDTFYSQNTNKKFIIVRRNLSQRQSNLEEIIKLNSEAGQDNILKECNLQTNGHKGILKYFHHQLEYYVVLNLDDDLTFIFPIVKISLSQQLHKIQKVVDEFITKEYKYAWNKQIGYLTNKNEYLGSGVTVIYEFPKIAETEIQNVLNEQTKGQCNSVINSGQFVFVNSLNEVNIQIFRNVIHAILLKQKNKLKPKKKVVNNQIHELDCYKGDQLWAPSYECFQIFEDLYAQYIQKEAIEVFNSKNIAPRKNHSKIDPNDIIVDLPTDSPISNIKCTFYRNIKNVKYLHEMSYSEKQNFKVQQIIFEAKYKNKLNNNVQLGKNHHIEATFECQVQEFKDQYIQNWNQLEELDKEIGFQSEGNFGYKGPILNEVLLEGFQLEITSTKHINPDLIKTYNYKPVLMQDQNLQKDEPIKKIISNRPCLFDSELKFIRDIQ